MKSQSNNVHNNRIWWLVGAIVVFVLSVVAIMVYVQSSYAHKLQKLTLSYNNGPVSPEYQRTVTLTITKDSCNLSTNQNSSKEIKNCPIDTATFTKIQTLISEYGVLDKIIANSSSDTLIGGKQATLELQLNNGDSYSTTMDPEFVRNLQPFLEQLQLTIPSASQVIPE